MTVAVAVLVIVVYTGMVTYGQVEWSVNHIFGDSILAVKRVGNGDIAGWGTNGDNRSVDHICRRRRDDYLNHRCT